MGVVLQRCLLGLSFTTVHFDSVVVFYNGLYLLQEKFP